MSATSRWYVSTSLITSDSDKECLCSSGTEKLEAWFTRLALLLCGSWIGGSTVLFCKLAGSCCQVWDENFWTLVDSYWAGGLVFSCCALEERRIFWTTTSSFMLAAWVNVGSSWIIGCCRHCSCFSWASKKLSTFWISCWSPQDVVRLIFSLGWPESLSEHDALILHHRKDCKEQC